MWALVADMLLCTLLAFIFGPFFGIAAALWLPPIAGAFFAIDARLLHQWRSAMLNLWVLGSIDFHALADVFRAISTMPRSTLEGMLESLPKMSELSAEQEINEPTRGLIAFAISADSRYQTKLQCLKLALSIAVAVVTTTAIILRNFVWVLGLIPVALLAIAIWRYWQAILARLIKRFRSHAVQSSFDIDSACIELGRLASRGQLHARWSDLVRSG